MTLHNKLMAEPWAITAPALQKIMEIAARENAIEAVAAKKLDNSYKVTLRDGIAIIPVVGPLFRYANLFTNVSGATSYEILAKDFNVAMKDPNINAIILNIDSPGGEVNGCSELADMIYAARGKKPVIAYASGDVASGAYWIASACDELIVSKTSSVGSIGVVAVYGKSKDDIEIVSTQSPNKRPDIKTDAGKAKIQNRIDALANVFIESIAKYKGIDKEAVLNSFGGGDVFIGQDSVTKNMASKVGSFETVLNNLKENIMGNNLEVIASERARIAAILTNNAAKGRDALAEYFAFNTDMAVDAAIAALEKAPVNQLDNPLNIAMNNIRNPEIEAVRLDEAEEDAESIARRLASY